MVALREREEAEDQEDTYQIEGNYILDRGGRCSMATCSFDADGTEVDYGNTPDSTPVAKDQESEIMNQEGEAQADEKGHTENTPTRTEAIPAPTSTPSPAHSTSPHRINVSVQGTDWAQGCTIAELEKLLAKRRAMQQQSTQTLKSKGWGTLVLPTHRSLPTQDNITAEGAADITLQQHQTAAEGADITTIPALQTAAEGGTLTSHPQLAPPGTATSTAVIPEEGNPGIEDSLPETEEEMVERKRKRKEAKK
jgi:hypothetical protein